MSNDDIPLVEVITGIARRGYWLAHEKLRIVEENLTPGASVSAVAQRNGAMHLFLAEIARNTDVSGATTYL